MTRPAPPGKEQRPGLASEASSEQTGGGESLDTKVTLTADELARHAELFFNFGATYALMQVSAENADIRKLAADVWKTPTYAELAKRRQPTDEPCGVRTCRGCSRCVRADAVRRGAVRT